jgi:hypothetical protein
MMLEADFFYLLIIVNVTPRPTLIDSGGNIVMKKLSRNIHIRPLDVVFARLLFRNLSS